MRFPPVRARGKPYVGAVRPRQPISHTTTRQRDTLDLPIRNCFNEQERFTHSEVKMPNPSSLSTDEPAPDFTLPRGPGEALTLSDLRGFPVVLVFYPADWSPVCGDQVALYNEMLPVFDEYDARIAGISVDGVWCHAAFSKDRKLKFPLLADFEPKGEIAKRYGVYDAAAGTTQRALFVIDADGIVRWKYVSPVDVNPGADGILAALDKLPRARAS